jgi:hypothetical protein
MAQFDDEITARNRAMLANMFDPAGSYGRACVAHIADGVRFRLIGDTLWSGAFANKHAWAEQVFMALPRELVGPITLQASAILVEGDHACVRAHGTALVRNGRRYDNDYCLVYRLAAGVIVEVTEYLDTALIDQAFAQGEPDAIVARPLSDPLQRFAAVHPASYVSSAVQSTRASTLAAKALVATLFAAPPGTWLDACAALLAEDVLCQVAGSTALSGSYRGRPAVLDELFAPLAALLSEGLTLVCDTLHGDGEWVWVQARGLARAVRGGRYDSDYCLVLRVADGAIGELIVYHDTARLQTLLR